MARRRSLVTAAPVLVLMTVALGGTGLAALLANPETIMRSALSKTQPVAGPVQAQQAVADHVLVRKVLASMADNGDYGARVFSPLTMVGPVGVGDRITITSPDGQLRSLEVVEVRLVSEELAKVADQGTSELLLIVSKVVGEPNAAKVRFIVETQPVVPFDAMRELVARSL